MNKTVIALFALAFSGSACAAATDAGDDDPGSTAGSGGVAGGNWGSGGSAGSGATAGSGAAAGAGASAGSGGAIETGGTGGTAGSGATGAGGTAGSAGGPAGTGNETLCNGIDDDQNGVIDDVDKGKDGVCDCLKIATLGVKGKYGNGDIFANWLASRSDFGAVNLGTQDLTPQLLSQYEVIIAQDLSKMGGFGGLTPAFTPTEVSAFEAWVKAGGGFMTLIGYSDPYEVNNPNTLLAPFGMSYGSQQILASPGGGTVPVGNWMPHPVTQGVSLIGVGKGYPVNGTGSALASQSGWTVLRAQEVGKGRVLMWGDEWITYDSEWVGHPEYQVELFWLNIIKWLSPQNRCQVPIPPEVK